MGALRPNKNLKSKLSLRHVSLKKNPPVGAEGFFDCDTKTFDTKSSILEIGEFRCAWVRNYVADVCHPGDVAQETCESETES